METLGPRRVFIVLDEARHMIFTSAYCVFSLNVALTGKRGDALEKNPTLHVGGEERLSKQRRETYEYEYE